MDDPFAGFGTPWRADVADELVEAVLRIEAEADAIVRAAQEEAAALEADARRQGARIREEGRKAIEGDAARLRQQMEAAWKEEEKRFRENLQAEKARLRELAAQRMDGAAERIISRLCQ